jgi:hypothetical protein
MDVWLVLLEDTSLWILVILLVQSFIFLLGTLMILTGYYLNLNLFLGAYACFKCL